MRSFVELKKSPFALSAICLLTLLLAGCHKPGEIQTESTYTFTNQTGKRITFDIYPSKEDYNQNTNRAQQYFIEPGANQKIVFDVMKKYWIDWYSADYSFSNWQSLRSSYNRSGPVPELNIAAQDDAFSIKAITQDTTRSVLLNGSGLSSTWRATISTSSQINGTHLFIFRKDFSGDYFYTDQHGATSHTQIEYLVTSGTTALGIPQGFVMSVLNAQLSSIFRITCNPGFIVSPHTGRDTMMIRFQQISGQPEFFAIRQ